MRKRLLLLSVLLAAPAACGDGGAPLLPDARREQGSPPPPDLSLPVEGNAPLTPDARPLADLQLPDKIPTLTATQALTFSHKDQPFQGVSWDSNWQPSGSPVQIRFTMAISATAEGTLPGKATLTRAGQLALAYAGDPAAGKVKMDIGFQVSAKLKIDTSLVKWEGNIPFLPSFDLRFVDEESFTPYVLQGASPRPVHLEDVKPKQKLFQVAIPGLSISVPGIALGGVVEVKAGGTLMADFTGQELATLLEGGPTLKHLSEGQVVQTPDLGKNPQKATASYTADVHYGGTITLYPTITITTPIPGLKWEVAEFPIPIDLQSFGKLDYTWVFAPQALSFDLK